MRREHYEIDARVAERHWWWSARRSILKRVLARHAPPEPSRTILEVGCSTGSNLPMLSGFGRVSAMEIDESAARVCRARNPGVPLFRQPIPEKLDRSFDMICAFDVIEHIEDEGGAVAWLGDHLEPEGLLFVTVPAMPFLWSRHDDDAHHFRRYTKAALLAALEGRFAVEYAGYFNTHLFPGVALVRLLQRAGLVDLGGRDKELGGTGVLNTLLRWIFVSEALWIPRFSLPFGVSLVAVARKLPGRGA